MNKKAQEFSAWGFIYGIVGFFLSLMMARSMGANWFWLTLTVVATTGICYLIGWKASG